MKLLPFTFLVAVGMVTGCTGSKQPQADKTTANEETGAFNATAADSTGMDEGLEDADPNEDEIIAQTPMPTAADELFDDFIFNFASNRRLQLERINFPLAITTDSATLAADTTGQYVPVERTNWQTERFFMNEGEYTLLFDTQKQMELVKDTTIEQVTVEKIMLERQQVQQYLFHKQSGQWHLQEVRQQPLVENPNASFIGFYHQFATDSVFQRESLSEAISFAAPDPDDDFEVTEGVITPDFWDAFAPELPEEIQYNIVYGQQDSASNQKIFVVRGISNGLELELTFQRKSGKWKLTRMAE